MSDESNEENEMTNPATDNDMIDTVAMPASIDGSDTVETKHGDCLNDDNAANDASMASETEGEGGTGNAAETEVGTKTWTQSGDATSQMPPQNGYVPSSDFDADGAASSGTYVRVPRDVPPRMPKPQPPAGPSKATIVLSLLPLFLGALMLFIGSASPMVFASIPGGVDVRSLIAMAIVMLGALLIVLAALLGLASLIHRFAAKRRAKAR
ncbi:hypothetical protein [Bifidobacterium sp. ESL0704]|uniref:hypothetical protein n=1 Tax=Bifidobacterium sp. ESL0704 TaxID=2983219 RepID=UPI0023F81C32|nr:hypothetical protein [Bifidobacterium sp. ESL0704]WEV52576.1 hypothetical protein OZX64_06770 [Bifidobacterium sp. ESL0704]